MNQQMSNTARRLPAPAARSGQASASGSQQRNETAGATPRFYRPSFKVRLPEGDAGFVPGYN